MLCCSSSLVKICLYSQKTASTKQHNGGGGQGHTLQPCKQPRCELLKQHWPFELNPYFKCSFHVTTLSCVASLIACFSKTLPSDCVVQTVLGKKKYIKQMVKIEESVESEWIYILVVRHCVLIYVFKGIYMTIFSHWFCELYHAALLFIYFYTTTPGYHKITVKCEEMEKEYRHSFHTP